MIKKFGYLAILLICFVCFAIIGVSCTPNHPKDEDIIIISPTKEFTVNSYIQSDMVLQKNVTIDFNGTSDPNVEIIIDITNSKNQIVSTGKTLTDKNGNWELSISSPDNNKLEYSISIYDSFKKYIKKYENIVFGTVITIFGEKMFFNEPTSDYEISKYYNVRICSKEGTWYQSSDHEFTNYITTFINQFILKNDDTFMGFIDLSFESASIGSFLKKEILENNSDLKTYNNAVYELLLDDDKRNITYANSELYDKYLAKFVDVKCNSLITYQGMTDYYSGIGFNKNSELYSKSLSILLKDLKNNFNYKKLLVIETPSISYSDNISDINDIALLRAAQSTAAYYNNGIIVPIYELGNDYQIETDRANFVSRLVNIISNKIFTNRNTPSYANLIITEEEIIIEISNCLQLNEVEYINNFKIHKINGEDVTSAYRYYINDNRIFIRKEDESAEFSNISILYNFQADISEGNLYNEENEMVNPFIIVLESDK